MILPIIKQETERTGLCHVPSTLTYAFEGDVARRGARAFADFIADAQEVEKDAFVTFFTDETLDARDEIYRVTVLPDRITVGFRDARGAVNGAATVALLLRKKELSCREIIDYPDADWRSFLLDFARGVPTEQEIFATLRSMALAKYNRVHLHLIDHFGPCYGSDAFPEYKFTARGEPCSKKLLKQIVEACEIYEMEIIPELEIPAHARALTHAHPEFKCIAEDPHGWAICPGNDDVWQFFDKLVTELVELFPESEYLHIGTDELEFRDLGPEYYCYWDTCPRCEALREREGLADKREEFYYVVERMHEIVKSHGKKLMMWNDQIDVSRKVPLSRDILIQFWRIAAPGRGPVEGCTMEKFIELGFRVVNSHYPYTYTDQNHYLSTEKMKTWNHRKAPDQVTLKTDRILGGEGCAWMMGDYEDYPFLGYVIPPVLAILGDKLWDTGDREQSEAWRGALAEFLFGSAEYTCIFDAVGDSIPPRKPDVFLAPDTEMPTRATVDACLDRLKAIELPACRITAQKYIALFEKIAAQLAAQ